MNPRILILDEATSALDNMAEYYVQKAVNREVKSVPPLSLRTGFRPFATRIESW